MYSHALALSYVAAAALQRDVFMHTSETPPNYDVSNMGSWRQPFTTGCNAIECPTYRVSKQVAKHLDPRSQQRQRLLSFNTPVEPTEIRVTYSDESRNWRSSDSLRYHRL